MANDEKSEQSVKLLELYIDHAKHITTLNTGSILIMAAFLEKLFAHPRWRLLIGVSFGGFIISIIGCLLFQLMFLIAETPDGLPNDKPWTILTLGSFATAYLGFLIGILTLAIFSLRNFF